MQRLLHIPLSILLLLTTVCFSNVVNAQRKAIEIIEKKEKKRVLFFAENTTATAMEVFFKIDGKGFRKSSYRPIIKKVPANTKVLITTAISLENSLPEYTFFYSFDEQLTDINVNSKKDFNNWKALDEALDRGETIVFTKDECKKCEKLVGMLKASRIAHKELNISKYERFEDFFWKTVSKYKQKEVYVSSIPIVITQKEFHQNIQLIPFVDSLKE